MEPQFDEITIHHFDGKAVGLVEFGLGVTPIVLASVGSSSSIAGTSLYVMDDGGRRYDHSRGPIEHDEAERLASYWLALSREAEMRAQHNIVTIGEKISRTSTTGESFLISVYKLANDPSSTHVYTICANSSDRGGQYRFQVRAKRESFDDTAANSLAIGKAVDVVTGLLATANGNGKRVMVIPAYEAGWCVY